MVLGLLVANQANMAAMFDKCWDPPCRVFRQIDFLVTTI
jgi:hypothetical protein